MNNHEDIKLGNKVKDSVTGLEGIVTQKVEHLNGCVQFCVQPKKKTGTDGMPDGYFIDFQRLTVIGQGLAKETAAVNAITKKQPGGAVRTQCNQRVHNGRR